MLPEDVFDVFWVTVQRVPLHPLDEEAIGDEDS
jgi:hypothetical protein